MGNFIQIQPADVISHLIDGKKILACILNPGNAVGSGVKKLAKLTVGEILELTETKNVAFFEEKE